MCFWKDQEKKVDCILHVLTASTKTSLFSLLVESSNTRRLQWTVIWKISTRNGRDIMEWQKREGEYASRMERSSFLGEKSIGHTPTGCGGTGFFCLPTFLCSRQPKEQVYCIQ
mmetsp:Transcript_24909/g.58022  ORF Transcript_24909/g.58022 Transcript_24909/m.58022 type:complete len:113 (-) Transcript_24909:259-597(-)